MEASPDDPFLFKRFVDVHINRESLKSLSISDFVALPLHLALSLQFLKAVGAKRHLMKGQNLGQHLHFDSSSLIRIDLNNQPLDLLLDLVAFLLILYLLQLIVRGELGLLHLFKLL